MARATVSCSHPQRVAVVLNFDNSGWHIDNTRLIDGIAGFVEHTALNFEVVIRPVLTRNHKRELTWLLVSSSTTFDCSVTTATSISSASQSNSSNDFAIYSCLKRTERGAGTSLARELGMYREEYIACHKRKDCWLCRALR